MPAPIFPSLTSPAAPFAAAVLALSCMAVAMISAMMKKSIKTGMKVASATIIAV
jgi:hypothetical protein